MTLQFVTPSDPTTLIKSLHPKGYRWEVVAEGETIASGTTATELEARIMAKGAVTAMTNTHWKQW